MREQGGPRRSRNGHDKKEKRNADGAPAEIHDAGPPSQEAGGDERYTDQQDRLHDELLERRGLVREDQGNRGDESEAQDVQEGEGNQRSSGIAFEDRGDW